MVNNLCVIIREPLGSERCTLGLRTALAAQVGGFETELVFMGEGVHSLTGALPAYLAKTLATFIDNEGRVSCLGEDLEQRGIAAGGLSMLGVNLLSRDQAASLLDDTDSIHVF